MELPQIIECDATECAYNSNNNCHAGAITVGGEIDHRCDTFCTSPTKAGDPDSIGQVGACKVASCSHNEGLECSAPGIRMGHEAGLIDCLTFSPM